MNKLFSFGALNFVVVSCIPKVSLSLSLVYCAKFYSISQRLWLIYGTITAFLIDSIYIYIYIYKLFSFIAKIWFAFFPSYNLVTCLQYVVQTYSIGLSLWFLC